MTSDRQWICVTPTRNEAWIIERFLAAAKTWADRVVVADQCSTDGTRQLLQNTEGVEVIINNSAGYDEAHRQRILLDQARRIEGRRILIGLDADEALSANCTQTADWDRIKNAAPGTVLRFRWVNVLPGFERAWIPPAFVPFGFVDDGSEHSGRRIHSPRVPQPPNAPVLDLEEVVVLHFQYVAWERMISKHRWYQAWEYATHRTKGPLEIFREYHHMHGSWDKNEIHALHPEWVRGYDDLGIDFRSLPCEPVTWWDMEVLRMLREHGPEHFRMIALWDADWNAISRQCGNNGVDLSDPRSTWERIVHRLLKATQNKRGSLAVRGFERLLRDTGW